MTRYDIHIAANKSSIFDSVTNGSYTSMNGTKTLNVKWTSILINITQY